MRDGEIQATRVGKRFRADRQRQLLLPGSITATLVLVVGYVMFKRLEPGFADYA